MRRRSALRNTRASERCLSGRGGLEDGRLVCEPEVLVYLRQPCRRGVWAAPAGEHAELHGIEGLSASLTRQESETLHAHGVNCLRTFPGPGSVVWGARTMAGADTAVSEWKFLPVRRLSLFLEQSLYRGTRWVVFRTERRAALVTDPDRDRDVHERTLPERRVPGPPRPGLLR
jgi:Phage tail sheath protein subtilisin-like domain